MFLKIVIIAVIIYVFDKSTFIYIFIMEGKSEIFNEPSIDICSLCYRPYDDVIKVPMMLCHNQHLVCK
jgi:hypothetical protein